VKRILVSWIGHTDLKAMAASVPASQSKAVRKIIGDAVDSKVGTGPLKAPLDQESFDQVHLLADYAPAASKEFAAWIGCVPKLHNVNLKSPTDHGQILDVVRPNPKRPETQKGRRIGISSQPRRHRLAVAFGALQGSRGHWLCYSAIAWMGLKNTL